MGLAGTREPAPASSTPFGRRGTLSLQHDIESLQKHFSWAFVGRFRIFMITNRKKKIYQSVRFDFILGVMHLGLRRGFLRDSVDADHAVTGRECRVLRLLQMEQKWVRCMSCPPIPNG